MLDGARVRYAAVTPTKDFQRANLIGTAHANLAALTADPQDADPRGANLSWLRAMRANCAQGYESSWTDALHALTRQSLAYLDAADGADLIAAAAPSACRDKLSADTRAWLDLYAAIAARDPRAMGELGEKMLASSQARELKYFALVAAMLGRLANHEPERVTQIYRSHEDVAGDLRSSPEIRLLLALALIRGELTTTEAPRSLL